MKKIFGIFVMLCLCIGMTGCGSSKPKDMSSDNYDIGVKILNATDQYLDGDLTADEAKSKIDTLRDRIDDSTEDHGDVMLRINAESLSTTLVKAKSGIGADSKTVENKRDEIAELLNK